MYKTKRTGTAVALLWVAFFVSGMWAQDDAATQRYFTGNALYNRKMYKLAIEEYKVFLEQNPTHAKVDSAKMGMAMCWYSMGEYTNAVPVLSDLVEKGTVGDKIQLQLLLAQSLLKLKKMGEAETVFNTLSSAETDERTKKLALAGVLETRYAQKKWDKVVPAFNAVLEAEPDRETETRALYQGSYALHQLKKFKEAIPYLEKLTPMVKGDKLAPQVAFFLAESYRLTDRLADAAGMYRAAARGFKGAIAAEIYYRLGFVEYVSDKYAEAQAAFESCLKSDPKGVFSAEACLYLGRCCLEQNDPVKAAEYLDSLLDGSRKVPKGGKLPIAEAALWRARIYSRAKKYAEAASFIAGMLPKIEGDPLVPDLLFDQANSYIAVGEYNKASAALKKFLASDQKGQANDALRLYAVALHHNGDLKGSLVNADKFIAAYENDKLMHEVLFVKAENLYFLKKYAEAEKVYSEFLEKYPGRKTAEVAAFRLVQIHHRNGKWDAALLAAAPFVEKPPQGKMFRQLDFILGDSCFRLKKWPEAAAYLKKFTERYPLALPEGGKQREPNADSAMIELAISLLKQKSNDEAVKCFKLLADNCPDSPHVPLALTELGRLYYEKNNYAAARKMFEQFVEKVPDNEQRPMVESYLGWISLAEGKDSAAEKHFSAITEKYADDPLAEEAYLQLGLVQLAQKKYEEAGKSLKKLKIKYPNHAKKDLAAFSSGVCLARMKKWTEAVPLFQQVAQAEPPSEYQARAFYELAWCEKGKQNRQGAAQWYRKLIEKYPEHELVAKVRTELAELTFEDKNYDEVIAQLKDTLDKLDDKGLKEQTVYRLGTAYFNKGDLANTISIFESFIQEFPASKLLASVHFQAGESYMKNKETEKAREQFLAASKQEGMSADLAESVLIRLAETQKLTQQWAESEASYAAYLEKYPKSKWLRNARFGYAWALEKQKKHEEAIAEYVKVISSNKDELSARAQFQKGECLFAMKKYDEAIKELIPLQVVYRYEEWAAKALLETGRIMEAKGDKDAAMDQFKEVIKKFPKNDAATVAKQRMDSIRTKGI